MVVYVLKNGEKTGPFYLFELKQKLGDGSVSPDDLAWMRDVESWRPVREIEALKWMIPETPGGEALGAEAAVSLSPPPLPTARYGETAETITAGTKADIKEKDIAQPSVFVRYGARMLDFYLFTAIVFAIGLGTGLLKPLDAESHILVQVQFAVAVAWALIEAALLSTWGTTLGKFAFGIRVEPTDPEQKVIGTGQAVKRSLMVAFFGWGLWYLPLRIFAMFVSYFRLRQLGDTIWDERSHLQVRQLPITPLRFGVAIAAAIFVWLMFWVQVFPWDEFFKMLAEQKEQLEAAAGRTPTT